MSKFFKLIAVLLLIAGLTVFMQEFLILGDDDWGFTLVTTLVLLTSSVLFFCVGDLWSRVKCLEKENEKLKIAKKEENNS